MSTLAALLTAFTAACSVPARAPAPMVQVGAEKPGAPIAGVDGCDRPGSSSVLRLDPAKPLTIFVHGCRDSGARFHELADVFEGDGQQAACFNYDHRASLEKSSGELISAVEALEARLPPGRITVLAHSQGGLVARRAFIQDRPGALRAHPGFSFQLLTVATPFGGVQASKDCGKTWLQVLSLGMTSAVCNAIVGENWAQIPPGSRFMTHPGTLLPEVESVLEVRTDEQGACRPDARGRCEPDFVFALAEQQNAIVESDPRVRAVEVKAGHVEIVGGDGNVPEKLIAVLHERGVLAQVPGARPQQVASAARRSTQLAQ